MPGRLLPSGTMGAQKTGWLALAAVALLVQEGCKKKAPPPTAAPAAAGPQASNETQETYPIRFARDRVGQKTRRTFTLASTARGRNFFASSGLARTRSHLEARGRLTVETLDVLANGMPLVREVIFEKLETRLVPSGSWTQHFIVGVPITIRIAEVDTIRCEGQCEVSELESAVVRGLFHHDRDSVSPTDDTLFGQQSPVAVGGHWEPDSKAVIKEFRHTIRGFGFDDTIEGGFDVVSVEDGVLRVAGDLRLGLNTSPVLPDFKGTLTWIRSVELPLDLDEPARSETTKLIMTGNATAGGQTGGVRAAFSRRFANIESVQ